MKYVIWGIGIRGKRLLGFLGNERVVAFVDNNESLQGSEFFGKPVISYLTYKLNYKEYPLILSMLDYKDVEDQIRCDKCDDILYFILANQPTECQFQYKDTQNIFDKLPFEFDNNLPCVFYGLNLVGTEIITRLKETSDIYLIPANNDDHNRRSILQKKFPLWYNDVLPSDLGACNVFLSTDEIVHLRKEYNLYNIFDFSRQIDNYFNKKIKSLEKQFVGKRCFIIANGPSLKMSDLDMLYEKNEFCIGMNRIFESFSNTLWRPDLYLCNDILFINEFYEKISNMDVKMKFIGDMCNENPNRIPSFHLVCPGRFCEKIPFSSDVSHVCYDGGTITYTCLQFATYMGFSKIYLLGVDFTNMIAGQSGNHFYKEEAVHNNPTYPDFCLKSYRTAKKYADTHGIKIYNATRGGKLEVFPRVNFDSLF